MKKVTIDVKIEKKVDNRTNNTGRPVNKKSARQVRLRKQKLYNKLHSQFIHGVKFKINNSDTEYVYNVSDNKGYISGISGHVCNIDYIGRTKVTGYSFVLNKRVNVEINLKEVKFV